MSVEESSNTVIPASPRLTDPSARLGRSPTMLDQSECRRHGARAHYLPNTNLSGNWQVYCSILCCELFPTKEAPRLRMARIQKNISRLQNTLPSAILQG